jgi:predicted HTH domain antitoxin
VGQKKRGTVGQASRFDAPAFGPDKFANTALSHFEANGQGRQLVWNRPNIELSTSNAECRTRRRRAALPAEPLPHANLETKAQQRQVSLMSMSEVTIHYPSGLEDAVETTPEEVQPEIRLMAALKMFELGKLSSGKAAELAGLSRADFFDACARYRVSVFNYPHEQLERELRADMDTAARLATQ